MSEIAEPLNRTETALPVIPLIARGRIIEDGLVENLARGGRFAFLAPDLSRHMDALVLKNPRDMRDLYQLSMDEILDYLEELGRRLDVRRNPHVAKSMEMLLDSNHYSKAMTESLFDVMPAVLDRASIEEIVERNIGRAYLDGWVRERQSDREVDVRAFGARTVHVIAGNVPIVAILTVIMNAVTRSDAIIKIPSNDPYFSIALARTMIEMAPDHPITRHLAVAYWKGGDARVEQALYDPRHIEKIVAWGGFAGMKSIRSYLQPGLDLIALDPKISGSIIGREALQSEETMRDAARKTAQDVGFLNQGGCANARSVYIDSGLDDDAIARVNRFGELVFEELQGLPKTLSSAHPAFDGSLRAEINGIRYSDAFRVFGGRASEGAVIVSQADEDVDFADRLDCRVVNIVPVDGVDAALRHVTIHMQTIGVYPDSLKPMIRDECAWRGTQRIVSLGRAVASNWVGPWDAMEPMRRMVRWLRDDTQTADTGVCLPTI